MKTTEQIDYINNGTVQKFGTVIIESLQAKDKKTGTELYNDLLRYMSLKHEYVPCIYSVNSAAELDDLFEKLMQKIKDEYYYFNLQLEAHGDKKHKGMILSNGGLYDWERLFNYTRRINVLFGNNLTMMMSMCVGGACVSQLNPKNYSPFRLLISAFEDVYPYQLYAGWLAYYEEYLDNKCNLQNALNSFNACQTKQLFHHITDEMAFNRICDPKADPDFFRKMVNERFIFEQYIADPNIKYEIVENNIINILHITHKFYKGKFCYRSPYLKDISELQ
jgi:hypothetical protein